MNNRDYSNQDRRFDKHQNNNNNPNNPNLSQQNNYNRDRRVTNDADKFLGNKRNNFNNNYNEGNNYQNRNSHGNNRNNQNYQHNSQSNRFNNSNNNISNKDFSSFDNQFIGLKENPILNSLYKNIKIEDSIIPILPPIDLSQFLNKKPKIIEHPLYKKYSLNDDENPVNNKINNNINEQNNLQYDPSTNKYFAKRTMPLGKDAKSNEILNHQQEIKDNYNRSNGKILPIDSFKNKIIDAINNNKVSIICGETGCGKTTRVPQFIYDDCIEKGKTNVKILITQPRRIAAISISNRLKEEISNSERDSDLIGYHVGMEPKFSDKTKILIVTTGIFLQRLINENTLDEFSHIIIDEVHERDTDIDLVLVLLKHFLKKSSTKVILMSATISTHLFANYFSENDINNVNNIDYYKSKRYFIMRDLNTEDFDSNGWAIIRSDLDELQKRNQLEKDLKILNKKSTKDLSNYESLNYKDPHLDITDKAHILNINDKVFQVSIMYIEQIVGILDKERRVKEYGTKKYFFDKKNPKIDPDVYKVGAAIVEEICNFKIVQNTDILDSILVFLPGVGEIHAFNDELENQISEMIKKERVIIMHLHSNVTE